jgi:iron(III) transport system ATP-binding protein
LRKSFDRKKQGEQTYAIDGVSFDVPRSKFVTLLGPSGCGKTTTLRCVAGLETADAGRIEMAGNVVFDSQAGTNVRTEDRPIAMVPQSYGIWPHMTVLDNAAFPLRYGRRRSKVKDIRKTALDMLAQVGLEKVSDRWATQLSGGQQQRLALARALLGDPEILLLDEPLSNLDAKLRAGLRHELRDFQSKFGVTSLYVTHDQAEALAMSDLIVVMNAGKVEQMDTPEKLYAEPQSAFVADFIGSANLFPVSDVSLRADGSATAKTDLGVIECGRSTANGGDGATSHGRVCVRPEHVVLRVLGRGGSDVPGIRGVIESSEFLGDRFQVVVDVRGQLVTATSGQHGGLRVGDEVEVIVEPATASYLSR